MFNKILVAFLCLLLIVSLCACENKAEEAAAISMDNFMERMKVLGFEAYDVSHQYEEDEIHNVGRAEKAKEGVFVYLYVMESEEAAAAKAGSFTENFEPDCMAQYDEQTITAEMNDTVYLVCTKGSCVYFEYAPEGYDIDELVALVSAGTISEEG